jgi:hypothetical protein
MSSLSPSRTLGAICGKFDAQVAYRVQIQRSTYVWKAKEISFPMPLVPHHYQVRVGPSQQESLKQVDVQNLTASHLLGCWPVYRIGAH